MSSAEEYNVTTTVSRSHYSPNKSPGAIIVYDMDLTGRENSSGTPIFLIEL